MPDALEPALRLARPRSSWRLAAAAVAIASAAGLAGMMLREPARTAFVVVPVGVIVPAPQPVLVPPPAPTPVAPVAPPPPPVAEPAPIHAATPMLDPNCLRLPGEAATDPAPGCTWDDGLPAISRDGKLIARMYVPGEGGARDTHELAIDIMDVATSRTVYDQLLVGEGDTDRAQIARRVAILTRKFDLSTFRALTILQSDSKSPQDAELDVEIDGDAVRLIDRKTHLAVLRYRFPPAPAAHDPAPATDDPERCHISMGPHIREIGWDATSRTAMISASFSTSPCWCENPTYTYAVRVPRP